MSKKAKEIIRQKALETFDEKTVGVALYTPPEWIVEAVKEYRQSQLSELREAVEGLRRSNKTEYADTISNRNYDEALDNVLTLIDNLEEP